MTIPPVMRSAGVTSNAGLKQSIPSAAMRIPLECVISSLFLSSIVISSPVIINDTVITVLLQVNTAEAFVKSLEISGGVYPKGVLK